MGDVAHGNLDLLALLAEFLAGTAHHEGDQGQDGQHHQRQAPVHQQQRAEQEHHRHAFANDHLDGIGSRPGDHGHVEGDARDQVPGVVLVEVAVGQAQQVIEQLHPQVMDQAQRDLGQEVVAQKRSQALPGSDDDDQRRHRVQQVQVAQVRDVGKQRGIRVGQAVDEILEDVAQHWLGRCKDQKAQDTQQEHADVGSDITK